MTIPIETAKEVSVTFEICGLKCVTCEEKHFTHMSTQSEAAAYGEAHKGHIFTMDCFYTKPPELAGKRCHMTMKPQE